MNAKAIMALLATLWRPVKQFEFRMVFALCFGSLVAVQGAAVTGNIGDGDVQFASVRQVLPDGFGSGDIWYGQKEPWNGDMTRLMYWENDNVLVNGQYGLGLVWARVQDLKSWNTLDDYLAIRRAINPYPYQYATDIEWSPFAGEENIVYAARLADRMVVKKNLDTGVEENVISYDPGNGRIPSPVLRRWTTDSHLIVMLDGADDATWVNGVYEIDVQAKTRRYIDPAVYSNYWALPRADLMRWPVIVSHGHGAISPDYSSVFNSGSGELQTWLDGAPIKTFSQNQVYTGFNHLTWRSSNHWWISDDLGKNFSTSFPSTHPLIDTFGLWQCHVDGTCKLLLEVQSAQDWNNYYVNWPTSPIATVRKDGRQLVFTTTNGKFSHYDFLTYGATPWSHRMLFLADLVPTGTTGSRCDINSNGAIDALDLQSLVNAILIGSSAAANDINRDSLVNVQDAQVMVNVILGTGACPL